MSICFIDEVEFCRVTNTGYLLSNVCNIPLFYSGDLDGEAKLDDIINGYDRVCILYPDAKAVTMREYVLGSSEDKTEERFRSELSKYLMVVIDGTWTQVKGLKKRLLRKHKNIQCIKLGNVRASKSVLRKETQADRVSTAEAINLYLEEIGVNETITNNIWDILQQKYDIYEAQSGRDLKSKAFANQQEKCQTSIKRKHEELSPGKEPEPQNETKKKKFT